VITIRVGDDAVATLFNSFSIDVVEPKTPYLGLIKEAALALVVEEFAAELANPVGVVLLHFDCVAADDMPNVFAGRLPFLGTGCQHPAARHCCHRDGEGE
jgi:hypothetical protein